MGGVLLESVEGLMGVVYGEALVKDGRAFLSTSLLWWGMVFVFVFGMISGLGIIFLKLFILSYLCSVNKEACIFDVLSPPVGENDRVWNLRFYRKFNDWELTASFSFLHFIESQIPRGGGCDNLCWCLNGSGKFDIRYFYNMI